MFIDKIYIFATFFSFNHKKVVQAIIIVILGIVFDINNTAEQKKADIINNVLVAITAISVVINIIISAFDMRETSLMKENTTKGPLTP
jgi:Ninjurin